MTQTSLNASANVYYVSSMLGHISIRTTEERYISKSKDNTIKSQETFSKTIVLNEEIIDVDIVKNKFIEIKNLYPDATMIK